MSNLYIMHYGVGHDKGGHSGRYPWGSGENPFGQTHGKKLTIKESNKIYDRYKKAKRGNSSVIQGEDSNWDKYIYESSADWDNPSKSTGIYKIFADVHKDDKPGIYDDDGFSTLVYDDDGGYNPDKEVSVGDYWSDVFEVTKYKKAFIKELKNNKEMYNDTVNAIRGNEKANFEAVNQLIDDLKGYDVKSFRNKKGVGIWSGLPQTLYELENEFKKSKNVGYKDGKFYSLTSIDDRPISDEELLEYWYDMYRPHLP